MKKRFTPLIPIVIFIGLAPTLLQGATTAPLVSEDFSKFTEGTESAPDTKTISTASGEIPEAYTHVANWRGKAIRQAGGIAFVGMSSATSTGFVQTPALDLSKNSGISTVRFRARLAGTKTATDYLAVLNVDPTTNKAVSMSKQTLSDKWQDFTVNLPNGVKNGFVQIYAYTKEMLIDDISVAAEGLPAPIPLAWTDRTPTSFTANWKPVEGAVSYILSVYHKDENDTPVFDIKDAETTETSYNVAGLTAGIEHYCTLKAKDAAGNFSAVTEWNIPIMLDTPTPEAASNVENNRFTANWKPVAGAEGYLVYTYIDYTAKSAGAYSIVDTDFSNIKDGTLDAPLALPTNEVTDSYFGRTDWYSNRGSKAAGYFGLDNALVAYYGNAYLRSPLLDYSIDGGKSTIELSMLATGGSTKAYIGYGRKKTTGSGTEKIPNTEQEFAIGKTPTKIKATLSGGTANSFVYISLDGEYSGKAFIDDLKVSQSYPIGGHQQIPLASNITEGNDKTSLTFDVPTCNEGERIGFIVYSYTYDPSGSAVLSAPSEITFVDFPSGVNVIENSKAYAFAIGRNLYVINPENAPLKVYNTAGMLIYAGQLQNEHDITLPASGLYIVRIGSKSFKVTSR